MVKKTLYKKKPLLKLAILSVVLLTFTMCRKTTAKQSLEDIGFQNIDMQVHDYATTKQVDSVKHIDAKKYANASTNDLVLTTYYTDSNDNEAVRTDYVVASPKEELQRAMAEAKKKRKDTLLNKELKISDLFAREKDSLRNIYPKLFAESSHYDYQKFIIRYNDTIDGKRKRKVTFMVFSVDWPQDTWKKIIQN